MKLNEDLHKELISLKATADFHLQQLQDAVRRTFLAMNLPLNSSIDLDTGEVNNPLPSPPAGTVDDPAIPKDE